MSYDPCAGCGGEDCPCCEVWLERQADVRYFDDGGDDYDWRDSMYDYGCDYYDEEDDPDDAPEWWYWEDDPEDYG